MEQIHLCFNLHLNLFKEVDSVFASLLRTYISCAFLFPAWERHFLMMLVPNPPSDCCIWSEAAGGMPRPPMPKASDTTGFSLSTSVQPGWDQGGMSRGIWYKKSSSPISLSLAQLHRCLNTMQIHHSMKQKPPSQWCSNLPSLGEPLSGEELSLVAFFCYTSGISRWITWLAVCLDEISPKPDFPQGRGSTTLSSIQRQGLSQCLISPQWASIQMFTW